MVSINDVNHTIMFGGLTNEQLDSVVMAIKFRRSELAKETKRNVTIGCKVRFVSGRNGKTVIGTVSKINRKTIIVREAAAGGVFNTNWRVPANMLEVV